MTEQSTAGVEVDEHDEPAAPSRRRSKRLLRRDDDGDAALDLSPEKVRRLIMTELAVEPPIAGQALGSGRNTSYAACHLPKDHKGHIESYWVGNKLMCPTAPIRKKLGLEPSLPVLATATPIEKPIKPVSKPRKRLSR